MPDTVHQLTYCETCCIGDGVRMSEGKVRIPQNPGIGVEVDRDTLKRYGRRLS